VDARRGAALSPGAGEALAGWETTLRAVGAAVGLEYFGIDCTVLPDGTLFVFEADAAMLVHGSTPIPKSGRLSSASAPHSTRSSRESPGLAQPFAHAMRLYARMDARRISCFTRRSGVRTVCAYGKSSPICCSTIRSSTSALACGPARDEGASGQTSIPVLVDGDVVLDDDDDIIPYLDKKYGAGAPA